MLALKKTAIPWKRRILLVLMCMAAVHAGGLDAAEIAATTVAVLPFHVDGGDGIPQGQGQVMGELLTGELLATGRFTVVERIQLDKAAGEMNLQAGGQFDPSTAAAIGKRIGAQVVVIGTLAGTPGEKLVMGRFVDVGTGSVIVAKSLTISSGSLLKAAQGLVKELVNEEENSAADLQKKAERLQSLEQTDAAMDLYLQLAARYSRTSVAPDAVLNLAQYYLDEGSYFDSADQAESLLETYPEHPLVEEALLIMAESKYFTVFGDPNREQDPRTFADKWRKQQSAAGTEAQDSIRLKARLVQDAKKKYQLLLAEFPNTRHAGLVKQRLAVIDRNGGR